MHSTYKVTTDSRLWPFVNDVKLAEVETDPSGIFHNFFAQNCD